jgi:hypothetical protein
MHEFPWAQRQGRHWLELNYLVLIEQIGLLPALYGSVLVPEAVHHG